MTKPAITTRKHEAIDAARADASAPACVHIDDAARVFCRETGINPQAWDFYAIAGRLFATCDAIQHGPYGPAGATLARANIAELRERDGKPRSGIVFIDAYSSQYWEREITLYDRNREPMPAHGNTWVHVGHGETLYLACDSSAAVALMSDLQSFEPLNDKLQWEIEEEEKQEAWESWIAGDYLRALDKLHGTDLHGALDAKTEGLRAMFDEVADRAGEYIEPDGDSWHIHTDRVADATDAAELVQLCRLRVFDAELGAGAAPAEIARVLLADADTLRQMRAWVREYVMRPAAQASTDQYEAIRPEHAQQACAWAKIPARLSASDITEIVDAIEQHPAIVRHYARLRAILAPKVRAYWTLTADQRRAVFA